jgi:isoquinoline 1-oxidoreductase alpha subunit
MPTHTFILNGEQATVDAEDSLRLLWVLRDILGVTGPKYGCALNVCKACTCHINGRAFNPCSVRVSDIKPTDEITTIEGLPATVRADLHPMQQSWLDYDVVTSAGAAPTPGSARPSRQARRRWIRAEQAAGGEGARAGAGTGP